jgi:hypothetical protein
MKEQTKTRNGNISAPTVTSGILPKTPNSTTLSQQAASPVTKTLGGLSAVYSANQMISPCYASRVTKSKLTKKGKIENMKISRQLRIPSALGPRGIYLSSLRRGDWLRNREGVEFCIIINSAVIERSVVKFEDEKRNTSYHHSEFINCTYIGRGKTRWWWKHLPVALQERVSPYSKP